MSSYEDNQDKVIEGLAYDLRSFYSKITGFHLVYVAEYRKNKNYKAYWEALKDLYIVIRHKIVQAVDGTTKIEILMQTAKDTMKKYHDVINGNNTHPDENTIDEIEKSLFDVETYFYDAMNKARMFGETYTYDEDEI